LVFDALFATWGNSRTLYELKVRYLNFLLEITREEYLLEVRALELNDIKIVDPQIFVDHYVDYYGPFFRENGFDQIVDVRDAAEFIFLNKPDPLRG